MAKRKQIKKKIMKLLGFILCALGLVSILMFLLPCLGIKDTETTYTGFQVVFGCETGNLFGLVSGKINFNVLGFIALLCILVASIVALLFTKNRNMFLIVGALFLIGAILTFLLPTYTSITSTVLGSANTSVPEDWILKVGSIISGILSSIGVVGSVYGYLA